MNEDEVEEIEEEFFDGKLELPNPGYRCRYCMRDLVGNSEMKFGHELQCPERGRVEAAMRSLGGKHS